jgi:hypothetical protein
MAKIAISSMHHCGNRTPRRIRLSDDNPAIVQRLEAAGQIDCSWLG